MRCEVCGKGYSSTSGLKAHVDTVHLKRVTAVQCETCKKVFRDRSSLCAHRKMHASAPAYKCPTCGRGFFHHSTFRSHVLVGCESKRLRDLRNKTKGKKRKRRKPVEPDSDSD